MESRIVAEIEAGVDVYYDREWPFTRRFCHLLLERPQLFENRDVLVVGAGVGLEAVVVGGLCAGLWVNDRALAALELLRWQLRENGITDARPVPGSFAELDLPPVDLIVACFVVYDRETRDAALALEARAAAEEVPLLVGGEDIGGHLSSMLERVDRPIRSLRRARGERVVLVGRCDWA